MLVGLGGVIAAVRTLRAITREVSATEKAANAAAAAVIEAQRSANIADRSADAAADSARAAADTLATNREIERAYIALSHRDIATVNSKRTADDRKQAGVKNDPDPDSIEFVCDIKNFGRTPGDVVGGFFGFVFEVADVGPDLRRVTGGYHQRGHLTKMFLLPDTRPVDFLTGITLGKSAMLLLTHGHDDPSDKYLWFVAEVDYRDRFGNFHRGGYGRRFDRHAGNFIIDSSTVTLNYDRPLTSAEIAQRAYT